MRYVRFAPGEDGTTTATVATFEGEPELRTLQDLVGGGYIEQIGPLRFALKAAKGKARGKAVQILGNEDAAMRRMAPTVTYPRVNTVGGFLLGPILVLGLAGERVRNLTDKEVAAITAPGPDDKTWPFFMDDE